jgi:hypothetical protein
MKIRMLKTERGGAERETWSLDLRACSCASKRKCLKTNGWEFGFMVPADIRATGHLYTPIPLPLSDVGLRRRRGQEFLENLFHFRGLESEWSRAALVGDSAVSVDHIQTVRPCGVRMFRGIREVVDNGRNTQGQLGGACSLHRTTLGESLGAGHGNMIFLVVFVLPGVESVGFHDVDHIECGAIFILVVELIERGNLPAEWRSSVTPENEHHRFLPLEGRERDRRLPVRCGQIESRSGVADLQRSPACDVPELLERKDHHHRVGDVAHHPAEQNRLTHHIEQPTRNREVHDSEGNQVLAVFANVTHFSN